MNAATVTIVMPNAVKIEVLAIRHRWFRCSLVTLRVTSFDDVKVREYAVGDVNNLNLTLESRP